ncbi:unnamed protein product [Adineta ricciae]|uniref:Protein kinase domain-containing protein n=1 Tax=Adineta ricciae TaxID=249248 RepID=A0A814RP72_ADIRI|nr:unnamed protein product [Adineta ricciae]CAF1136609.1 unnamed protein product [Adineta ricciae]
MGGKHIKNQIAPRRPDPTDYVWLERQTFHIRGDEYTLLRRLGNGSFGSVWVSTTPSGFYAAVKVFDLRRRRSASKALHLTRSFETEIRMAYEMRNAGNYAATIYGFEFDRQRNVALIAMELGDDSLKNRVQTLHRSHRGSETAGHDYISASDRKNIWLQLVEIILALDRLHVIHRDLKPSNLVFFGPVMKLIDFGISQKEYSPHEPLIGDRCYAAPECLSGGAPITTKADIWSAGGILYYMTYGSKPYYRSPLPPPNSATTRSVLVQEVIHHCLRRNLHRRANHQWLAQHPLSSSTALG